MGYAEAQYVIDEILEKIKPEVTFRGDLNARLTLRSKTALNVIYVVDLTENDLIPNTNNYECQKTIWVDPGLYSTSIALSGVYSVSGEDIDATNILTKSLVKYDTIKKYVKRITTDSVVTLPGKHISHCWRRIWWNWWIIYYELGWSWCRRRG